MKNKVFLISFVALILGLSWLNFKKVGEKTKIQFKVVTWNEYNICFLLHPSSTITKTESGFTYKVEENSGTFEIFKRGEIHSDYRSASLGDFEAGIKKTKNFRLFEYKLSESIVLRDTFLFAKKTPANLLPVRKNCSEYLQRFKVYKAL